MLTEKQVEDRKRYLGGSEAAACLGMSRWESPLQLWARKTGQVEPEDISGKLAVKLGNRLEQVVVELFEEATGKKAEAVNQFVVHPEHDFLCANLDRRIVGENAILEVKTASGWKAKEWEGEDIPREYQLQVMHYLAVTGADYGYLAVLIGGNQDFKWKVIQRDEEAIKEIIKREVEFWTEYVVPKVMPQTITSSDGDVLFKLFPGDGGNDAAIELDDEGRKIVESIKAQRTDIAMLKDNLEKDENCLKALLGNSVEAVSGNWRISWKPQITRRLDTARLKAEQSTLYGDYTLPVSSRVLRITEKKEGKTGG